MILIISLEKKKEGFYCRFQVTTTDSKKLRTIKGLIQFTLRQKINLSRMIYILNKIPPSITVHKCNNEVSNKTTIKKS